MSNTTNVYYDLEGTSLETYAFNLETKGGSLKGTPAPRGDNRGIPFQHGKRYVPKYRDSRILTFQMWVIGQTEDGAIPSNRVLEFEENWAKLADMFDFEGQKTLTKRWIDLSDGVTVRSAAAEVEYNSGLEPTFFAKSGAKFSPSLLLADPWFYGGVENITVDGTAKTIKGTHASDRMVITFAGGTNPSVTIAGRTLAYDGSPGGNDVVIDVQERSAIRNSIYVNGLITVDRTSPDWLSLPVGSTTPTKTGGGTVTIAYYPRYR